MHEADDRRFVVEVTALFGDSIIEVKHLCDANGGRVTTTTRAALAIGAALLGVSAFAFQHGLSVARSDQRALGRWIDARERPATDLRPERMSRTWDVLAFGGAAAAAAFLAVGVERRRRQRFSPVFRVGCAPGVDVPLDDVPDDVFDVVAPRGREFVVRAPRAMTLYRDTAAGPLAIAGGEVAIAIGGRYRIDGGTHRFVIASVPAPQHQGPPLGAGLEGIVVAFLAGSVLLHLGLLALVRAVPSDDGDFDLDDQEAMQRLHLERVDEPGVDEPGVDELAQPPSAIPDDPPLDREAVALWESQARCMALTEGAMGIPTARAAGLYQIERRRWRPEPAHGVVVRRGLLGAVRETYTSFTGVSPGSDQVPPGQEYRSRYAGCEGDPKPAGLAVWFVGFASSGWVGSGRYGRMGSGWFGCGEATAFDLATPSALPADWDLPGIGLADGGWGVGPVSRHHEPRSPTVEAGRISATGDLDPNLIRRHIGRKLPQIRSCYERRLATQEDLEGTVVVQFQISPHGVVQGASAAGMESEAVESCVAAAIETIQFPKPAGGGFVHVRSPFSFQPSG